MGTFDRLKELDLTRDEINRFGEALKKPEFKKLLNDYVEEIQDPKNKELYEKEITQLEKERGNDITFIHPKPCYVIKTSVNGEQKAFINICVNDLVKKPTSTPTVKEGEKGLTWHLPHSLSPPRDDLDNKRKLCTVYDVIFHSDTLHLANRNKDFRGMVNNVALDAVESNFGVTLDKKNLKFPKLSYKGISQSSVIRTPCIDKPEHSPEEKEFMDKIFALHETPKPSPKKCTKPKRSPEEENSKYTTPTYLIKHRSHVDLEECTEHKGAKLNAATPKELVVEINLPLLKSSTDINLDVTEKTLQLICEKPAKYKLNLTLPYQVNEISGNAKFEKDKKKLIITLPVKRSASTVVDLSDSGVESDQCSPGTPDSEEEIGEKQLINEITPSEPSEQYLEKSIDFRTNFLDENLHYTLPEFTCHVFENTIAFTLNVKNVDDKSVEKSFFDTGSSVHVKFTSIGSSFYPTHYAFYVKFPLHNIIEESASVEVWDNNVILQIPLNCDIPITSYLYGISDINPVEKYVEEPEIINQVLEQVKEEEGELAAVPQETSILENNQVKSSVTENVDIIQPKDKGSVNQNQSSSMDLAGTSYESSGDELSCSSFSPSRNKGILKRLSSKRCSVGRSISESSLDNFVFLSAENCYTSLDSVIPEDGEVSSSEKKTVRFNDVVMSQLFRSNSSILGQKKKNQRKARNKKRALERRYSESEASGDEKKEGDSDCNFQINNEFLKKDDNIFHLEVDN